jgi:hypothetical protein
MTKLQVVKTIFLMTEKQPKVKYKPQNIYVEKKTGAYTMAITILVFVRICRAWYPRILSNILHYF